MKREDVKELYSITSKDGTLLIVKRDVENWLKCQEQYSYTPDMLANPEIKIMDSGVLSIKGIRLSYKRIRTIRDSWHWAPTPIRDLKENWKESIFFVEDDVVEKDIVTWVGKFPFKKRKKEKAIKHLADGYYLSTNGYDDVQTTSNYRLIGYSEEESRGII